MSRAPGVPASIAISNWTFHSTSYNPHLAVDRPAHFEKRTLAICICPRADGSADRLLD
jgi:hypothetical protein